MTTESRIIPIVETSDDDNNSHFHHINNGNNSPQTESESEDGRKPSYVGLSCAVSGYSQYIRYTSPSRKNSPPGQTFKVGSGPQILDCNDYNFNMRNTVSQVVVKRGTNVTPDTSGGASDTTDFYHQQKKYNYNLNNNLRETSPGSDTSSVGGSSTCSVNNGGNLVQKQIERLYGAGKMSMVRLTSPEPKSDSSSPESLDYSGSKSSPLDLKTPLKVPAVFRLLRPEFREQLKSNSCQVKIPTDMATLNDRNLAITTTPKTSRIGSSSERIIPISVESKMNGNNSSAERIIPVVKNSEPFKGRNTDVIIGEKPVEKPALSPKPISPTRTPTTPRSPLPPASSPSLANNHLNNQKLPAAPPSNKQTVNSSDITSPALVSSLQKSTNHSNGTHNKKPILEEPKEISEAEEAESEPLSENFKDTFEEEDEEELMEDEESYPACGIRERSLLCPIQEEDTESTASGSSLSVGATKRSASAVPSNAAEESNSNKVIQEEVHDGHYFIKLIENEIFKFEEQICDFEEDLSNEANDIADEVRDHILAAIGKAKLLMSQKLTQFRGLCDKNIHSNPEEDPFVPTSEDLAGFWDMVYIQVEHIHSLFAELTEIRKNGWKRPEVEKVEKKEPVKTAKTKSKTNGTSSNKNGTGSGPKSEAAKARDEARRKMLEEKKRQMKLKQQKAQQQQPDNSNNECIFVEF